MSTGKLKSLREIAVGTTVGNHLVGIGGAEEAVFARCRRDEFSRHVALGVDTGGVVDADRALAQVVDGAEEGGRGVGVGAERSLLVAGFGTVELAAPGSSFDHVPEGIAGEDQ